MNRQHLSTLVMYWCNDVQVMYPYTLFISVCDAVLHWSIGYLSHDIIESDHFQKCCWVCCRGTDIMQSLVHCEVSADYSWLICFCQSSLIHPKMDPDQCHPILEVKAQHTKWMVDIIHFWMLFSHSGPLQRNQSRKHPFLDDFDSIGRNIQKWMNKGSNTGINWYCSLPRVQHVYVDNTGCHGYQDQQVQIVVYTYSCQS